MKRSGSTVAVAALLALGACTTPGLRHNAADNIPAPEATHSAYFDSKQRLRACLEAHLHEQNLEWPVEPEGVVKAAEVLEEMDPKLSVDLMRGAAFVSYGLTYSAVVPLKNHAGSPQPATEALARIVVHSVGVAEKLKRLTLDQVCAKTADRAVALFSPTRLPSTPRSS